MPKFFTLFFVVGFATQFFAQQLYSRARIWISNDQDLATISNLGIDISHTTYKKNTFIESDFSDLEIQLVRDQGYQVEILIEDVSTYYEVQGQIPPDNNRNVACLNLPQNNFDPVIPANFELGTYAGYFTTQEMFDHMTSMRNQYPNIISESFAASDTLTHEGRTIFAWRISNNPDVEQNKPKVLYTALIHAREPGTLSNLIFYMWYLLENYGTDPEVTFLIDHTELYFVPMLNPDGYARNETTNPNGGGMHRKNRNPNHGTSNRGVDLNRNFSYLWGTTGVSFNQNSDTYPGTGPFSEPETKVFKKISEQWGITNALNAHTHGRLLLFPIGASSTEFADDHDYFQSITNEMTKFSNYDPIKSSGLYPASGDTDDYMYISEGIFAMTPEIGGAFWSPQGEILDDCIDMLYSNLILAHLPHVYGVVQETDESVFLSSANGAFSHSIQRLGQTAGPITVSISPVLGIQSVGNSVVYQDLELEEMANGTISYVLEPTLVPGDYVKYALHVDNGLWTKTDTITKIYGLPALQFVDNAADLGNWTGDFELTTESFVSDFNSFTDSPFGDYNPNSTYNFQLNETIDLTNVDRAVIRFYAKWEIEADWDYAQFQVSTDGGQTWVAQCGKYTNLGVSNSLNSQPLNKPLYDGFQSDWVLEEIDMSEYIGMEIKVRFQLKSDTGTEYDGFYFDDFQVHYRPTDNSGIDDFQEALLTLYPNPAKNLLKAQLAHASKGTIQVIDAFGRLVQTKSVDIVSQEISIDTQNLDAGIYYFVFVNEQGAQISRRFSVMR